MRLNPWYVILWRLFWYVPVVVAACFFALLVLIGFGKRDARVFWRSQGFF
jgi:hypothetical protein